MHTRDAQGRQVSLLNDDPPQAVVYQQGPCLQTTYPSGSGSSLSSTAEPPFLIRSNSYDSQNSGGALSPMTPGVYDYGRTSYGPAVATGFSGVAPPDRMYDSYGALESHGKPSSSSSSSRRTGVVDSSRSTSYDDDSSANSSSVQDRPGKRYPCRYRDTHGCDKTFTTSGHASRHSKIHTAEKAVPCTYPNCHKKFTRADNMKQHLETHYKDKSRTSGSRSSAPRSSATSATGGSRRTSASSSRTGSTNHHHHSHHHHHHHHHTSRDEIVAWEAAQYAQHQHSPNEPFSIPSPVPGTQDVRLLNTGLGGAQRHPNSGLDALAMAVACQEGSGP
ncbi:C2H2 transcription factor [Zalerion maritima]|uniref:C2H2 transcription factor n=1 Tax=Zalerion maritima TaxID=339359 RepID=A0AAD5WVV6_9PEZI|nr:C2H2 transcription factor [Zalerion maritima]